MRFKRISSLIGTVVSFGLTALSFWGVTSVIAGIVFAVLSGLSLCLLIALITPFGFTLSVMLDGFIPFSLLKTDHLEMLNELPHILKQIWRQEDELLNRFVYNPRCKIYSGRLNPEFEKFKTKHWHNRQQYRILDGITAGINNPELSEAIAIDENHRKANQSARIALAKLNTASSDVADVEKIIKDNEVKAIKRRTMIFETIENLKREELAIVRQKKRGEAHVR